MSDDSSNDAPDQHHFVQPVGNADPESVTDDQLEAYDLDGDGKISLVENERARLGILDARIEEFAAEHDGIAGTVAEAAHHIVDRLDND
jgi:hypothetical protein